MESYSLFDRDGQGGREITSAVGLLSDRVDFDTWRPLLPLGMRDVAAIIGRPTLAALCSLYHYGEGNEMVAYAQQAVALFTWLKIIPTLDAQHDNTGRARRIGENEKGLTALEQYKDEANIQRLAYEAVDTLIEEMELQQFGPWLTGDISLMRRGLLIRSKEEFDRYYVIGSHRLFVTLLPMIREVQQSCIAPIADTPTLISDTALKELAANAVALLTMKKAVERLPVEVLPEGVVQVNQSAPVAQRLKAETAARNAVAAALGADADRMLRALQDEMAQRTLGEASRPSGPIVHPHGMTF